MIFRTAELFAGPGGGAYAAKTSHLIDAKGNEWGFKHAWANEFDRNTVETYKLNILNNPDATTVYCEDVRQFDFTNHQLLSDIDALIFGFPCNDFSVVGKQKGLGGTYGPLYTYGVKALKEFQPKVFVAENVGGLTSANDGDAFIQILKALADAGYTLTPNFYKFEEYGVPQARHRILIVGIRNDLAAQGIKFHVPAPTTPNPEDYVTAGEALTNPPIPEDAFNNEPTRHNASTIKMLSYIPEGGNAWSHQIPEDLRLNVKVPGYLISTSVSTATSRLILLQALAAEAPICITGAKTGPSPTVNVHGSKPSQMTFTLSAVKSQYVSRSAWQFRQLACGIS